MMAVALLIGVIVSGYFYVRGNPMQVNLSGPSQEIKRVAFETDGVLSNQWLAKFHGIRRGEMLMDVDIFELKNRLENFGQIQSATVERVFPSTLKISVSEYKPILRVRVPAKGKFEDLMIADNGHVYSGEDYPESFTKKLPFLGSAAIFKEGNGYKRIPEVEKIVPLLELAKSDYANIYETWRIVSFRNINDDAFGIGSFIYIRSSIAEKIIFKPNHYEDQMDRLSVAIRTTLSSGIRKLGVVDVSLDSTAVVQLASK
jgi:hypothetical protein